MNEQQYKIHNIIQERMIINKKEENRWNRKDYIFYTQILLLLLFETTIIKWRKRKKTVYCVYIIIEWPIILLIYIL